MRKINFHIFLFLSLVVVSDVGVCLKNIAADENSYLKKNLLDQHFMHPVLAFTRSKV